MSVHRSIPALVSSLFLAATAAPCSAAERVVFSGNELDHVASSPDLVAALDTTTFTTPPSSLSISFVDSFQHFLFRTKSDKEMVVPASIDWEKETLAFDYMTTSVTALLRIRVFFLAGGDRLAVDLDYNAPARGLPLVADGKWHTMVLKGISWTPRYHSAVADGFLNPDSPYIMRLSLQNFVSSGVLNVDNFRIVPKPAGQAGAAR